MTSSQDYYQPGMAGAGWWNPGRSPFPPCYTSVSDFMWLDSSLNDMDKQTDQMKQGGSYSRSDDDSLDDHHYSSSADDYAQTFQQVQNSQVDDFNISDLLDYTNNSNINIHHFYIQEQQLDSTAKEFQTSPFAYPSTMQSLTGPDTIDMSYGFDENSFAPNWPKMMLVSPSSKQQLTTNNSMPFWDSWMGNDEIDTTLKSHQLQAHVVVEDKKPSKFGNPTNGISLELHKAGSKDIIDQKLATCSTLQGTTKRKNSTSTTTDHGVYKRPRFETPSSLPTFKVRKEKLGDRITALQQLVSPFGKTDTASVLHEAIEYIKFLHDQVNVLRTPYTQSKTTGTPINQGELEGPKQDLKSHGLCLVSISSTFPLANETTSDFWTPAFGEGTFTFR